MSRSVLRRILQFRYPRSLFAFCAALGIASCTSAIEEEAEKDARSDREEREPDEKNGGEGGKAEGGEGGGQDSEGGDDGSSSGVGDDKGATSGPNETTGVGDATTKPEEGSTTGESKTEPEGDSSTSKDETKPEPEVDCQPGEKRSCSERPDGTKVDFPGGTPQGSCKLGEQQCKDGKWGACEGMVEPKASDTCEAGNDDNCNGVATDHCKCSRGETQACGSNVGMCQEGRRTCDDSGNWGKCEGETKPSKEICGSGKDEDCDGKTDLEDSECECLNNAPPSTCSLRGQGDCALGKRGCSNGRWGACQPRFPKLRQEACGTRKDSFGQASGDEDCDGDVDELAPLAPTGCTNYMVDEDNDGQGAMGDSANQRGARNPTHGCFCSKPSGGGWVRASGTGSVNADCGDCDRNVRVGQTQFFPRPSQCLGQVSWSGGAFDYNCNRRAEQQHTGMAECGFVGTECKVVRGYWSDTRGVPKCGDQARAGLCGGNFEDQVCNPLSTEDYQYQACR